jgi:nucleotide-binding universal stress UspA family protein
MTILCATDFSDQARGAEQAAAALAERLGLPLWLVHVQEPGSELLSPEANQQLQRMLETRLAGVADRLKPHPTTVKTALRLGRASEVVPALARELDAKLIVVGSSGHGINPLYRLGGTSERLAHGAELPVLVVREGDSFTEWAAGKSLRVLVGLDEGEASASALRWVTQLRQVAPVDVVLGRVYYAEEAHQRYGLAGRRYSFTDPDPVIEKLIERDLKQAVPELPGTGELFYRAKLGLGRVADHLLELAEAERCQLVVIGTHHHRGLARMWSVSAATVHLARMSVTLVPPDGRGMGTLAPSPRLRRVLVTTDFSTLGNAAVRWAYALADRGGEVILAHVTPNEGVAGDLADLYAPALPLPHASPRVETEVAARLHAIAEPFSKDRGVITRTEVLRSSDPAKAILMLAEQLGVDTLVISSHGRSGVTRAVWGSVTEAVLRGSHRPVFVVK